VLFSIFAFTRRTSCKLLGIVFLFLASFNAHAIAVINVFGVSLLGVTVKAKIGPVTITVDPASVQMIDLDMSYNTSLFSFDASRTGFLCDFSTGGDCPSLPGVIGTFTMPIMDVTPGTERSGTSSSLAVDPVAGTIHLHYDLTANPPPAGTDRNFFAIGLDPLVPISSDIVIHDTPGVYDFNVLSASCTVLDGTTTSSCGSNTPATGITFRALPEPGTFPVLLSGLAGMFFVNRRRG